MKFFSITFQTAKACAPFLELTNSYRVKICENSNISFIVLGDTYQPAPCSVGALLVHYLMLSPKPMNEIFRFTLNLTPFKLLSPCNTSILLLDNWLGTTNP